MFICMKTYLTFYIFFNDLETEISQEERMLATNNNETLDIWNRETSSDSPLFDFNQIANATGNFSSDNKLGEGGFGPVYKVLPICFHLHTAFLFLFLIYSIYILFFKRKKSHQYNVAIKVKEDSKRT